MIGFLQGILLEKTLDSVLIDVSGVGYEVFVPMSSFCAIAPVGQKTRLYIYTYVREDAIRLFGFSSLFDRKIFDTLLAVSSVGPKLALALMGSLNGKELCEVVVQNRVDVLKSIPGVGQKTAERLILELKSKYEKLCAIESPSSSSSKGNALRQDLTEALVNLGYKEKSIMDLLKVFESKNEKAWEMTLESALREILKLISSLNT